MMDARDNLTPAEDDARVREVYAERIARYRGLEGSPDTARGKRIEALALLSQARWITARAELLLTAADIQDKEDGR